jgi:hypothetical protein
VFVDAWGKPLQFYRWPTRLFRPTGAASQIDPTYAKILFATLPVFSGNLQTDLARDPDDPLGDLNSISNFEGTALAGTQVMGPTPVTYHVFLVVSSGPDQTPGIGPADDIGGNGYLAKVIDQQALADDIIYLNVRAGGK